MIGSAENESLKIIPGNWVPVIYKVSVMLFKCYNLIIPMTLTSRHFKKPQSNKTQRLNTILHQMRIGLTQNILCVMEELTAVGKTKRTVKTTQITANMIQRKLNKYA